MDRHEILKSVLQNFINSSAPQNASPEEQEAAKRAGEEAKEQLHQYLTLRSKEFASGIQTEPSSTTSPVTSDPVVDPAPTDDPSVD
jgi:hypothetical protein